MINFHSTPADDAPTSLRIVVVKAARPIGFTIVTRHLAGLWVHWWGGHTIVCCGTENCPACVDGMRAAEKFYVIGKGREKENHTIVLITPAAATQIQSWESDIHGIFGLEITLGRINQRNNSMMVATRHGRDVSQKEWSVDVLKHALVRIYSDNAQRNVAKQA